MHILEPEIPLLGIYLTEGKAPVYIKRYPYCISENEQKLKTERKLCVYMYVIWNG